MSRTQIFLEMFCVVLGSALIFESVNEDTGTKVAATAGIALVIIGVSI